MKKSLFSVLIAMLAGSVCAETLRVPEDYPSIQQAVNAAVEGDEILVNDGEYLENVTLPKHSLTLRSVNGPSATSIVSQDVSKPTVESANNKAKQMLIGFTISQSAESKSKLSISGGGVGIKGGLTVIDNCIFESNRAIYGGGVYVKNASAVIRDCEFRNNQATANGGGICAEINSDLIIYNCKFSQNSADNGGAICSQNRTDATMVNCLIESNTAGECGGGIFNYKGSKAEIVNCTIVKNNATSQHCFSLGGGVCSLHGSIALVVNSIVWANAADFDSQIFNDCFNTEVSYSCIEHDDMGHGNIKNNPAFKDFENGDYRLASNSPCIDAGNNAALSAEFAKDLNGNPRLASLDSIQGSGESLLAGDVCDMGAYEYQPCQGQGYSIADFNEDCVVDLEDLTIFASQWLDDRR